MQRIRRILVAVRDPGVRRFPAIEKAAQLARAFGAQVEIFHALSVPRYRTFNDLGERFLELVVYSLLTAFAWSGFEQLVNSDSP